MREAHVLEIIGKRPVGGVGTVMLNYQRHMNMERVQMDYLIFGEQEQKDWNTENIDWNAVDSQLISQRILVTRPEINGKKLSSLRLRNNYGINISRVYRSGVQLLATPDLRLQMGDRLTVVGEAAAIKHVEKILGNA